MKLNLCQSVLIMPMRLMRSLQLPCMDYSYATFLKLPMPPCLVMDPTEAFLVLSWRVQSALVEYTHPASVRPSLSLTASVAEIGMRCGIYEAAVTLSAHRLGPLQR